MNYSKFQVPENLLEDFDVDLQMFYHSVLLEEIRSPVSMKVSNIKQALREVVHAYKKDTVDCHASSILFDSPEKRCAYVMKHCSCFSSAVAKHFLQLIKANPSNLLSALHKRQVNLCCLGGGPGTEAVAIAKVVNAFNDAFFFFRRQKLRLKVQVIDLSQDWRTTADLVLRRANFTPELCDPDRMDISFELLQADLTKPFEEKVRKALGEADIITMVYFVSAVNGSRAQDKCASMLKNILNSAKPESFLFFLDSSKALHYHAVNSVVTQHEKFKRIYGPIEQEFHTLSPKSIKMYIKLYYEQFNALLCLTNCFITSASWIKGGTRTLYNRTIDTCVRSCYHCFGMSYEGHKKKAWKTIEDHNSKKQKRYREWVQWILLSEVGQEITMSNLIEFDGSDEMLEPSCKYLEPCIPCRIKTLCAAKAKQKRFYLMMH